MNFMQYTFLYAEKFMRNQPLAIKFKINFQDLEVLTKTNAKNLNHINFQNTKESMSYTREGH